MVKPGDSIPDVFLWEGSPQKKVSLAQELATGKGLIIAVPAAFSPGCTKQHIPDYLNSPKLADAGKSFVFAINDPFVMGAWGEILDPEKKSGIRFLADKDAAFTKAIDTLFVFPAAFGDPRCKRLALTTLDGKVQSVHIEPDNLPITAKNVLGE